MMGHCRRVTGCIALASLLLALIAPSANAGTVTSSNSDATGLCTQTIDQVSSVTVNRYGNDCVIRFARVGTTVWTVPASVSKIAVLIIAGGGGGGFDVSGGGGAGGLLYYGSESAKTPNGDSLTVTSGSLSVVVGDGGAGATSTSSPFASDTTGRGVNGVDSSITLPAGTVITAKGGGGGNSRNNVNTAQTGGSGGGGGYGNGSVTNGGAGTGTGVTRQGFSGGKIVNGNQGGGGGGGAGANGANWDDAITDTGGGGNGLQYLISGAATYYGGGGGGGSWAAKGGPGGLGGGGAGGNMSSATCRTNCSTDFSARTGVSGTANTGGGGGGSGNATGSAPGGAGGSGVVIIRYSMILTTTATISIASGALIYRTAKTISVATSTAGKVDFKANGKFIGGCRNVASTSSNSYIATCTYRPSFRGLVNITAEFQPADSGFIGATATMPAVLVLNRIGNR